RERAPDCELARRADNGGAGLSQFRPSRLRRPGRARQDAGGDHRVPQQAAQRRRSIAAVPPAHGSARHDGACRQHAAKPRRVHAPRNRASGCAGQALGPSAHGAATLSERPGRAPGRPAPGRVARAPALCHKASPRSTTPRIEMGEFAIGQSVSRFEDPRLLRGGGRYVGDIVLPGMVFGYVLRAPHAHARIRSIDTSNAKAAPGVLAVLTGADWEASGWGNLPVPGGLKRRDGSAFRPPYPALVKDRVRFTGDYVAFVVAETLIQAQDAAELIAVDYEPLPAVVSTAEATAAGATRVWDQCPDNIGFVQLFGDKAATEAAFANAAHVVKHRFVINRVTAARTEPRGSLGDYNAAEDRYTIYTTLQRAHPFRAELAPILKAPESKIRVVAGDIGGSFGMKSAVYNEVALVLLASKRVGRPVKWTSTRSESFLCDAQARDNVTQAELALDRNGIFLGLRVHTIASIGAYLQTGMPPFTRTCAPAPRVLPPPPPPSRLPRRFHPPQSGAPLSRHRPPGGCLCDRAARRFRRRRARHRSRRAAA